MPDDSEKRDGAITKAVDAGATLAGDALGVLAGLPPVVTRSLTSAVAALVTASADVATAWLESQAQAIRDKTAGRSVVSRAAADGLAKSFGKDEALAHRTLDHFAGRMLGEQENREAVMAIAIEDLKSDPPKEDSVSEIDPDFLNMFSRFAEQKTNPEMRAYLGKLLAGEIRKPGSFEPATVQVLATITPKLAQLFQRFCALAITFPAMPGVATVIVAPYGAPGDNALKSLGFDYPTLTLLQDGGLIQRDLTAWREFLPVLFAGKPKVGGRPLDFGLKAEVGDYATPRKITVINFTVAGAELFSLVHLVPSEEYVAKLQEWIRDTLRLIPLPAPVE